MRFGIRGKLVGTLMLAGLLPLALSLAATLYAVQEARTRFITQSFRGIAREHAEHLSTLLSAQIDLYRVVNVTYPHPKRGRVVVGGYCVARGESVFFSAGGVGWAIRGGRAGS